MSLHRHDVGLCSVPRWGAFGCGVRGGGEFLPVEQICWNEEAEGVKNELTVRVAAGRDDRLVEARLAFIAGGADEKMFRVLGPTPVRSAATR